MSDTTPEVLAEAKADGWADKDAWRGAPELWVDAAEFVRRKHTVLPLLRKENEKVTGALHQTQEELKALRSNMDEFIKYQQEQTVARLADQRKQLLAEKRAADEAGDDARVVQIEEALDENAEAKAAAKAPKAAPAPQIPPDLAAWQSANPWFGKDERKTGLAMGLAREAASKGLSGKPYFDHIDAGMNEVFGTKPPVADKSEGGGPSGGGSSSSVKGYASLPADAKAQCDLDAKRFVGENKMFKTVDAWREHFVKLYTEE